MFSVKKCAHCGNALPDEVLFCSECGSKFALNEGQLDTASVEAEIKPKGIPGCVETDVASMEPVAEKPAKRKKIKWWHITIPAVLVVTVVAALLLRSFFIGRSPKAKPASENSAQAAETEEMVLGKAFSATATDLSARVEDTPLSVMSKAYSESRKNTVTLDYEIFEESLGDMRIGMVAKIDSSINQSHIGIDMDSMGQTVDMNLYLDREVAAFNMDMYTGDDYYGIYYDTFGEDIRNNEFMYESLGKESVVEIEEAVDIIDQVLGLEAITPKQQAESLKKYSEVILAFVEEQDMQVGKAQTSVNGKTKNCKTISFTITTEDYIELMLEMIDIAETDPMMIYYYKTTTTDFSEDGWAECLDELRDGIENLKDEGEGECVFTFYLHSGKVVQADAAYESSDAEWVFSVNFGNDASVNDIIISCEFVEGEEESTFDCTLSTEKEDDVITEALYIVTQTGDDEPFELELRYEWDRKSGDFILSFQDNDEISGELECVFEELENGYHFSIPAVEDLVESMGEDAGGIEMTIDISVTAGAEIEKPETIKDIAKLTERDLMSIASKITDM